MCLSPEWHSLSIKLVPGTVAAYPFVACIRGDGHVAGAARGVGFVDIGNQDMGDMYTRLLRQHHQYLNKPIAPPLKEQPHLD